MIGSPDLLAFTSTEGFGGEEDEQEAQGLPEELSVPRFPSSHPWSTAAQFHRDFILVAEFSEQVCLLHSNKNCWFLTVIALVLNGIPCFGGLFSVYIVLTGWILINTKKASNNGVSTPAGNPRVLDIKVYEALEKG